MKNIKISDIFAPL